MRYPITVTATSIQKFIVPLVWAVQKPYRFVLQVTHSLRSRAPTVPKKCSRIRLRDRYVVTSHALAGIHVADKLGTLHDALYRVVAEEEPGRSRVVLRAVFKHWYVPYTIKPLREHVLPTDAEAVRIPVVFQQVADCFELRCKPQVLVIVYRHHILSIAPLDVLLVKRVLADTPFQFLVRHVVAVLLTCGLQVESSPVIEDVEVRKAEQQVVLYPLVEVGFPLEVTSQEKSHAHRQNPIPAI